MARLRDSYGATSRSGERRAPGYSPGLLAELRSVLAGQTASAAPRQSCRGPQSAERATVDGCLLIASVSMPLKTLLDFLRVPNQDAVHARSSCEPLGEALRCAFSPRRVNIAAQRRARQFHLL